MGALILRSRSFCKARTRRGAPFLEESRWCLSADFAMPYIHTARWSLENLGLPTASSRKPGPKALFLGAGDVVQ